MTPDNATATPAELATLDTYAPLSALPKRRSAADCESGSEVGGKELSKRQMGRLKNKQLVDTEIGADAKGEENGKGKGKRRKRDVGGGEDIMDES